MGENEARDSNAHRASAATGTCDMNWSREQVAASPSRGRVCDRGIRYFCLAPSLQNQPKGTISIVRSLFLACCERHANAVSEGVANMPCRPGRLCQTRYGQPLEFESRYPVLWARERRVSIKTLGLVCVTLSPFSSSIRLRVSISEYMRMYHC